MKDTMHSDDSPASACKGFNYCFWAKMLVAIPLLPVIALLPSFFFASILLNVILGTAAVFAVLMFADWLDKHPALQGMVCPRLSDSS